MNLPQRALIREVRKVWFATDLRMKSVPKVCGDGCSACCHQIIRVYVPEAPAIERHILEEMAPPVRDQVREALRRWLAWFDANTPDDRVIEEADLQALSERSVTERVPCPFLIERSCSLYKARPVICRTFSVNDDPALCEETPNRSGDPAGAQVQDRSVDELSRLSPHLGVRLLPYVVQEVLGLDHACKPVRLALTPTTAPVTGPTKGTGT